MMSCARLAAEEKGFSPLCANVREVVERRTMQSQQHDCNDGLSMQDRFLAQTLDDARHDYRTSLGSEADGGWDWVVVTASNERQAAAYRVQIDSRLKKGLLPEKTQYLVVPDRDGRRVGSGGATLSALVEIAFRVGMDSLSSQKVLLLHSGGTASVFPNTRPRASFSRQPPMKA